MFKKIYLPFLSLLLMSGCCWKSDIHREFVVCDDSGRPIQGAEAFLGNNRTIPMLAIPPCERRAMKEDEKTSNNFRAVTDEKGKFKVDVELYYPGDSAIFVISKGHYPTMVPIQTKSEKIVLLNRKEFVIDSVRHQRMGFRRKDLLIPSEWYSDDRASYRFGDKLKSAWRRTIPQGKIRYISPEVESGWMRIGPQDKVSYNSQGPQTYYSYSEYESVFHQDEVDELPEDSILLQERKSL